LGDEQAGAVLSLWGVVLGCSGGADSASGPTITVSGRINDAVLGSSLSGGSVCGARAGCTQTDADGRFVLEGVPASSRAQLRIDADGYGGALAAFDTAEDALELAVLGLASESLTDAQHALLGLSEQSETGTIAFSVSNGINGDGVNIAGVTVSIQPAGDGPFYNSDLGIPETEASVTGSNGGGVFLNVPAGEADVSLSGLPSGCTTLLGWGGPDVLVLPIETRRVSYARLTCSDE